MTTNKSEHVHFRDDDIARKEGKEHIDYPKEHAACRTKEPRVKFAGEDIARKAGKEHVDFPKTPAAIVAPTKPKNKPIPIQEEEPIPHPAKVKISKEDFLLHLKIFGFFVACFLASIVYDFASGKAAERSKVPLEEAKPKSFMAKLHEAERKKYELVDPDLPPNSVIYFPSRNASVNGSSDVDVGSGAIGNKGDVACSIYLSGSSIPAIGKNPNFGVFATKPFKEGDVVLPTGKTLFVEGMELSVHVMPIKYHPFLGNVKWTKQNGVVAKREIKEGEEMFIDFNDFNDPDAFANIYHNILHKNDPLKDDYAEADALVTEVMEWIPHKMMHDQPLRKNYKQRNINNNRTGKLVPEFDASRFLSILKRTVSNYNAKVERLIPDNSQKARSLVEAKGSARFISNRRSVRWITRHGVCLNGMSPESSCPVKQAIMIEERTHGAFTTRSVSAGEVIEAVPLFAMRFDDSPSDGNCISAPVKGVVLCPLGSASSAGKGAQCDSGVDECPSDMMNAKYQWSEWNAANKAIDDMTSEDFLNEPMTGLTLDVVAIRDIAKNSEVFIDISL